MRKMKERNFSGTVNPEITQREIEDRKIARASAADGMVLLKNENGFLPLPNQTKIALYGAGAAKTIKGGTGSGDVNERSSVSICEGMKQAGFEITNESWLRDYEACYQAARIVWRDEILKKHRASADVTGFFNIYVATPFQIPAGRAVDKTDADTESC